MYIPKPRRYSSARVLNAAEYDRTHGDPTQAQLADLFAVVLGCERHERRIPFTVATLRATHRP